MFILESLRLFAPILALLACTLPCEAGTAQGTGAGGQIPPGPFATAGVFTSDAAITGSGVVAAGNAVTVNLLGLQHDFAGELIITLSYLNAQGSVVQSVDLVNRLGQSAAAPYGTAADFGDGTGAGDNYLFNSDYAGNLWSAAACSDPPACSTPLSDLDVVPGVTNDSVNGGQYAPTTVGGAKTNLSYAFTGLDVSQGTWRLTITDSATPNAGSLVGWQIMLSTAAASTQTASAFAGTPQSTPAGNAFPNALQTKVSDGSGNALSGVTVTFTAPSSGASATFNGASSAQAITNSAGIALSPVPVANGTAGTYSVTASISGSAPATFTLTNTSPVAATSAVFQKVDTATRGNWKGFYGSDGSQIAADSTNLPTYAAASLTRALTWVWTSNTSDSRALLTYASSTNRIASTFYNLPAFTLDLNLSAGQSHQVALYLLDWDAGGRSQTVTISDAASNKILDTRSVASFQAGEYLVYNISGHVTVQFTQLSGYNAVLAGVFFDPVAGGVSSLPSVSISAPAASQTVSGIVNLSATASSPAGIASLQFQLDGSNLGVPITTGSPYTYSWNSASVADGAHVLTAIATDTQSQKSTASVTFTVSNSTISTASAAFVKTDLGTQGTWQNVYGSDGSLIASDSNHLPAYVSLNPAIASLWTWTASTSDVRALQKYTSPSDRIAATWYNLPGFTLDLNLTDAASHQVAFYLLDWDFGGRAQTVTITDAATQAVLDSRSISNFISGGYLVYNLSGHVNVKFGQISGYNAVLAGIFFDTPGASGSGPSVAISAPAANQSLSGTVALTATASSSAGVASLQFTLDNANLGVPLTASPYTFQWNSTSVSNGSHTLQAIATDSSSRRATASVTFSVNNVSGTAAAQFVKQDLTTRGSWRTVYGQDGEIIANDSSNLPGYAVTVFSGAAQYLWVVDNEQRALQQVNGAQRTASTFYASPSFSLDLNLTDSASHQLALYFLDWDAAGRAETVTIIDAASNQVLDTRSMANFQQGAYLVWNVKGHVIIQFTQTAGINAVVSGVFFAPAS